MAQNLTAESRKGMGRVSQRMTPNNNSVALCASSANFAVKTFQI
jgi:hypothetical protein